MIAKSFKGKSNNEMLVDINQCTYYGHSTNLATEISIKDVGPLLLITCAGRINALSPLVNFTRLHELKAQLATEWL